MEGTVHKEAVESTEFDFGPFKQEVGPLLMRHEELVGPAREQSYQAIIQATSKALIDSGGDLFEKEAVADKRKNTGVFAALKEVEGEVFRSGKSVFPYSESSTFAHKVAAEAVKFLLANRNAPSTLEATEETTAETAEVVDDGTVGKITDQTVERVDELKASAGL